MHMLYLTINTCMHAAINMHACFKHHTCMHQSTCMHACINQHTCMHQAICMHQSTCIHASVNMRARINQHAYMYKLINRSILIMIIFYQYNCHLCCNCSCSYKTAAYIMRHFYEACYISKVCYGNLESTCYVL